MSELGGKFPPVVPENYVTCSVCWKTLKTPKCLPCLHALCMNCLHAHIMASAEDDKAFKCPACGENTSAPIENLRREDWAKNFTSDPFIDSVLDALEIKRGDRKCDPCKSNRKRTAAITWCTTCREALCPACTNSHQGMRLTRSHAVIELSKIKSQSVAAIMRDERCPSHADQCLQFYCKDHKEQGCPICAITKHRHCNDVIEMANLGKEIRSQKKVEKLLKRLNACMDTHRNITEKKTNLKNIMEKKKNDIMKEICDLKQQIIDQLNNMENMFLKEFDMLHGAKESDLQTSIDKNSHLMKALSSTTSFIEAVLEHGTDTQLFLVFEKMQDECRKYETVLVENHTETEEPTYNFKIDERLKSVANSVKRFGHLSVMDGEKAKHSFKTCSVRETGVFSARAPFDDVRGIDVFVNGDVILSDRISKSVLLFNGNGEYVSHLNFQTRPWGVAVLGVRTACVTLPECQEIHIVKSSYRTLDDYKVINTNISCFSITNFSGEYLTIQHREEKDEKGKVTIAQSDKQISHKAAIDITANHKHVQGIAYDESTSRIFVATDFDALECYNSRGRILYRNSYTGYGDFRGMCVDRQSNVYIASFSGKGILQVTHEGEKLRMISTSPLAPLDVAISPRGNKMFVVGRSDMVYIYSFQ